MRILLITWNYPPKLGGMEIMLFQLVKHLSPYAEVDVIGPFSDEVEAGNGIVVRPGHRGLLYYFIFSLISGFRILHANSYDIIVGGSALVSPIACTLGWLFRLPVIAITHGLDLIYPSFAFQGLIRFFLPRCRQIVANSRMTLMAASKRGVPHRKICIIHPGVDSSEFAVPTKGDSVKEKYGIQDRLIILCAGRIAKRKGILEFVRYSLPLILERHSNVAFIIVGENPILSLAHREDMKSRIESEVTRLRFNKNVLFLGYVDRQELINLYHECDVFVLPAIEIEGDIEGFGIVLIEASAAGKPVVATRTGGIPDAVEHGKSGFLVAPAAWNDLADIIGKLLSDDVLRKKLGNLGHERVKKEFDWTVISRQFMELFSTVGHGGS